MNLLVQEVVKMGERQLREAGISNAKAEAELLYCHLMKIDRAKFVLRWSKEAKDREVDQFLNLCEKRASRIPLQHIIGNVNFMGYNFKVKPGVLIPRPETELLVTEVLKRINPKESLLDLCCGTGVIGISLCKEMNLKGTLADISDEALDLASENARLNGVKVGFLKTDMFEGLKCKKFNIITCNPPYIPTDEIPHLLVEVREHDPHAALDGGEDGLNFYRIIAEQAASHLKKRGLLALETGWNQGDHIRKLLEEVQEFEDIEKIKDLNGFDRILLARKK